MKKEIIKIDGTKYSIKYLKKNVEIIRGSMKCVEDVSGRYYLQDKTTIPKELIFYINESITNDTIKKLKKGETNGIARLRSKSK